VELVHIAPVARQRDPSDIRRRDRARSSIEVSQPRALFGSKDFQLGWDLRTRTSYEVASDGRFLFAVPVEETDARPIVAVVDWTAGLPR